jgi:putative component of membrane protein insertase Oxa1/YidC/SpoIIIJ protein YidD
MLKKMITHVLIAPVRFYQIAISPLLPGLSLSSNLLELYDCRHSKTWLSWCTYGTARILRCNPFAKGGVDYVPDHFSLKRNPVNPYKQ